MIEKIGIINDKELYTLLKNYLDESLSFYSLEQDLNELIFDLRSDKIDAVIIDTNFSDLYSILKTLKESKFKIILCDFDTNYHKLKKCIKKNLIDDYFEKQNYNEMNDILDSLNKTPIVKYDKLLAKDDNSKYTIVGFDEIYSISYDRTSRKCLINIGEFDYYSKKKLQEIEEILSINDNSFIRLDRSTIINIKKIHKIDSRDSYILFDNNTKLYTNLNALKEVKKSLVDQLRIIEI